MIVIGSHYWKTSMRHHGRLEVLARHLLRIVYYRPTALVLMEMDDELENNYLKEQNQLNINYLKKKMTKQSQKQTLGIMLFLDY